MRKSLSKSILAHLKTNSGIKFQTGEIERFGQSLKYEAETARRRADELVEDGLLHREKIGKLAYYWADEVKKEIVGYWTDKLGIKHEITRQIIK